MFQYTYYYNIHFLSTTNLKKDSTSICSRRELYTPMHHLINDDSTPSIIVKEVITVLPASINKCQG